MKLGFTYITTPSRVVDHCAFIQKIAGIDHTYWFDIEGTYCELDSPSSYQVEHCCNLQPEQFTALVNDAEFCELLDENEVYFIPENSGEEETLYLIKSRANRERLLAAI